MRYRLKRVFSNIVTIWDIGQKISRGIDYQRLNEYLMNINRLHELDGILLELSKCLKDILSYELFGFAVRHGDSRDLWIDPKYCVKMFIEDVVSADFPDWREGFEVHFFNNDERASLEAAPGYAPGTMDAPDIASFAVDGERHLSRLYIMPKRNILYHHRDIIDTITRMTGIALDNYLKRKDFESAAIVDPLTGTYNRRALDSYIEHDIANVCRYNSSLSAIMFDLDHFKRINDTYGHLAGDAVLRETCELVSRTIRKSDYIARYGGEEFLIVLPYTGLSNAVMTAEKLRNRIEGNTVYFGDAAIKVTASFGVAALGAGVYGKEDFLREVDRQLYEAKAAGRNRVMPVLKPVCCV